MPAPEAVEAWFRSVFDPKNKQGDALILDPAFRNALEVQILSDAESSGMSKGERKQVRSELRAMLAELSKGVLSHSAGEAPLPGEMDPEAIARRTDRYRRALQTFWTIERFRSVLAKNIPSHPTVGKVEAEIREFFRGKLGEASLHEWIGGESALAASQQAREAWRQMALERIDKALLPEAEKAKLRQSLKEALDAWQREHELRLQELGKVLDTPDTLTLSQKDEERLRKALSDYIKSRRFSKCMIQPLLYFSASEAITAGVVKALEPEELIPQLVWNGLMVAGIAAGIDCIRTEAFAGNRKLMRWALRPENASGIMSSMMATIGELSKGGLRPGNVIFGGLWTRYISVPKARFVNRQVERWREKGRPAPYVFYALSMLASEGGGTAAYLASVYLIGRAISALGLPAVSRVLFGVDDEKKKKRPPEPAGEDPAAAEDGKSLAR